MLKAFDYLDSIRTMEKKIQLKIRQAQHLRDSLGNVSTIADTMAMILDIEEEISELRNSMCKRQREILTILDKMEPEYATVLSGRFIEGKSVKELGVVLFLSRRQIERRMIDALAEFQIKLNDLIENGDLSCLSRNDS